MNINIDELDQEELKAYCRHLRYALTFYFMASLALAGTLLIVMVEAVL